MLSRGMRRHAFPSLLQSKISRIFLQSKISRNFQQTKRLLSRRRVDSRAGLLKRAKREEERDSQTLQGKAALAAAAAGTTMTPKRDPSYGGIGGRGSPARACADEDGDAGRWNSAAEVLAAKEQEIEEMRRRLKELEELDREILPAASASHEEEPESAVESATTPEKAEVDAHSIYVGNVDYACLPEDVQQHFHFCGTINRVTILTDSFGRPKGFAYVEFVEAEAVQKALLLNETELYGRPLKVSPKRTNIPGMKQSRGRHPSPFHLAYGKVPRFRRFLGYNPYY